MTRTTRRMGIGSSILALTTASVLAIGGVAYADNIQDTIADTGTGVTLVAGSGSSGTAGIKLIGNNSQQDPDSGCNIDAGENPLKLDIITPTGVTATPDPLYITSCGTDFTVSFTASLGASSGSATVTVVSGPAGGGTYVNQVNIPITIFNTKPTVTVTGVANGTQYPDNAVPVAGCSVEDVEDVNPTAGPVISPLPPNSLGDHTVTCDYTDAGGLKADTASLIYTVISSNTKPSVEVTGVVDGAEYKDNVVPAAGCSVEDAEDDNPTAVAVISTLPANGLGSHTVTCDYTDAGGLEADTASATYTVIASNTKPTVAITGVNNEETYELGAVPVVGCTVTDAEDTNPTATPVITGILFHGLGLQTATCDYTDQGGLTADTVSATYIIQDTGNPTIHAVLDPATSNGSNGWYKTDVEVDFLCADIGGSGIESCTEATVLAEGAGQSVTGTATDWAGNTASTTVDNINVDKTGPTITAELDPATPDGSNSWYTSDVTVDFVCEDMGSGIDSCVGDVLLGEGAGQSATGTASDLAGHTASTTVDNINVDKTGPTITAELDPATPNGSNGWYTSDVTVDFVCEDTVSGIDSCTAPTVLGEGAHLPVTGTATDLAGHTASTTVSDINVDKTGPTIATVSGVVSYFYGSTPGTATCAATDELSGLDNCTVAGFGATAVGPHTATATATDIAGNVTTQEVTYQVKAWTRTGFYAPVDMGGVLNIVKAGSTVPLKFEVFGDAEFTNTSAVKSFVQRQVTCGTSAGTDDIEFTTTGKTELRYDAVAGQFIQNWQTPKSPAGTCYVVTMTLQDGVTTLVANFKLK